MSDKKKGGGLAGVTAGETAIATVGKEGAGLTYRGYDIYDLAEHARRRQFRKDLFYALSVVHVKLPPLRERPGDIEDLARFFMDSLAGGLGLAPMPLDPERIRQLQEHDWPGNARELRSFIERVLMLGEFPSEPLQSSGHISGSGPFGYPEDWPLERVKTDHMKRVLAACDDNRSRAARRRSRRS